MLRWYQVRDGAELVAEAITTRGYEALVLDCVRVVEEPEPDDEVLKVLDLYERLGPKRIYVVFRRQDRLVISTNPDGWQRIEL